MAIPADALSELFTESPKLGSRPLIGDAQIGKRLQSAGALLARIDEEYRPTEVWLFGSRARGAAGPNSDWDFLVVVPDGTDERVMDPMRAWQTQKDSGVVADILVCTESDLVRGATDSE